MWRTWSVWCGCETFVGEARGGGGIECKRWWVVRFWGVVGT